MTNITNHRETEQGIWLVTNQGFVIITHFAAVTAVT